MLLETKGKVKNGKIELSDTLVGVNEDKTYTIIITDEFQLHNQNFDLFFDFIEKNRINLPAGYSFNRDELYE